MLKLLLILPWGIAMGMTFFAGLFAFKLKVAQDTSKLKEQIQYEADSSEEVFLKVNYPKSPKGLSDRDRIFLITGRKMLETLVENKLVSSEVDEQGALVYKMTVIKPKRK